MANPKMKNLKGKDLEIHKYRISAGRNKQLYKQTKRCLKFYQETCDGLQDDLQRLRKENEKLNNDAHWKEIIEQIKYANGIRNKTMMKVIAMLAGKK